MVVQEVGGFDFWTDYSWWSSQACWSKNGAAAESEFSRETRTMVAPADYSQQRTILELCLIMDLL